MQVGIQVTYVGCFSLKYRDNIERKILESENYGICRGQRRKETIRHQ